MAPERTWTISRVPQAHPPSQLWVGASATPWSSHPGPNVKCGVTRYCFLPLKRLPLDVDYDLITLWNSLSGSLMMLLQLLEVINSWHSWGDYDCKKVCKRGDQKSSPDSSYILGVWRCNLHDEMYAQGQNKYWSSLHSYLCFCLAIIFSCCSTFHVWLLQGLNTGPAAMC